MAPMPNNTETVLYLQGFAPLIQLWAGICLLFFYESLLDVSPFSDLCKKIRNLYNNFKNQYNGLILENAISADEYVKDHWNNNLVPTIKCIASMCFFYSVFILAFIGIEGCDNYGSEYYCALQITNTIVLIYLFCAIIFYKAKAFHGFVPSIILTVLLLIYFHFHFHINEFCISYFSIGSVWEKSQITIYTIFTCISGILLVCLRLFISWIVLQLQRISIYFINKEFKVFVDYNLGKIQRDKLPKRNLSNIMRRCNDKFKKGDISAIDHEAFLTEMKNEVANEYKDFTNKWWIKLF